MRVIDTTVRGEMCEDQKMIICEPEPPTQSHTGTQQSDLTPAGAGEEYILCILSYYYLTYHTYYIH